MGSTIASVGGAVGLGSVTDFMGLTDYSGQEDMADAANNATAASTALTKEQLAFQREQYEDWKDIYGELQEDIGTYYMNISGDRLAIEQIEAIQREGQLAQEEIDQSLAQRGLTGSGLEAEFLNMNTMGMAMEKAKVKADADELAMQRKMAFLGLGLGQGTDMLGINAQVANVGASNMAGVAQSSIRGYTDLSQANMNATGELIGTGVGLISGLS